MSDRARREWRRITDLLAARKCLDGLDQIALSDLILCWERLQDLEKQIAKEGVCVPALVTEEFDDQGRMTKRRTAAAVPNPNVKMAMFYRRYVLAWAKEMGLTLRARQMIKAPEVPAEKRGLLETLLAEDPPESRVQ